jgi:adenylate kinase family enzyme
MFDNSKLPQIIILYGPPNAGKGTQAQYLKTIFPDRYHLDFGTELRSFVTKHIGDMASQSETVNPGSSPKNLEVARRVKADMVASNPVQTPDLKFIIESAIVDCANKSIGMIVEGPGRLVEEAKWLAGFLKSRDISVCIFHLHLDIEEVLHRASKRYYLKGVSQPFVSIEDAQKFSKNGEIAYRRPEDEDVDGTIKRYKTMYAENFALITSIYQLTAKSAVFTLDARKTITQVSAEIKEYLDLFYS